MANKGKYYESQFEEATIELLRKCNGSTPLAMSRASEIREKKNLFGGMKGK